MSTLHAANSFFETSRPWELKLKTLTEERITIPMPKCDENALRLETIISMTMDTLRVCGIVLQPLLPLMSSRLLDKLGVPWNKRLWRNLNDHFGLIVNGMEPPMEASLSRADALLFKRISPPDDDDDQQKTKKDQAKKSKQNKKKIKTVTQ